MKFNKENAIKFADEIYKEENGIVKYKSLLSEELYNNYGDCCIIGYACQTFMPWYILTETEFAIQNLATCSDVNSEKYIQLKNEFANLITINDDSVYFTDDKEYEGGMIEDFKARAKAVKEAWLEKVVPLLGE